VTVFNYIPVLKLTSCIDSAISRYQPPPWMCLCTGFSFHNAAAKKFSDFSFVIFNLLEQRLLQRVKTAISPTRAQGKQRKHLNQGLFGRTTQHRMCRQLAVIQAKSQQIWITQDQMTLQVYKPDYFIFLLRSQSAKYLFSVGFTRSVDFGGFVEWNWGKSVS